MRPHRFRLAESSLKGASFSLAPVEQQLDRYQELEITLVITSAELDDLDEQYDFYLTTENEAGARWDLVHFPRPVADEPQTYVARLRTDLLPQQVTTAAPGVASVESGTIAVATGQANAIKSLAAGRARHGPWGSKIGYELVVAGTVTEGVAYSIQVEAR